MPTAERLAAIYGRDYVHFSAAASACGPQEVNGARHKVDRCRRMARRVGARSESAALLDVGCGAGTFVSIARGMGYRAEGIDLFLPEENPEAGLRRSGLETIASGTYDIVAALNVAEHLVAPREFFSHVLRVLRRPGVLLLSCPNGASLARRLYRERWIHAAPEEHLLFWTPASLTSMLRAIGFNGPVSCRVGGSPFPFGRARPAAVSSTGSAPATGGEMQQIAWRVARRIQANEALSSIVRAFVNVTRTGDYLEYIVAAT